MRVKHWIKNGLVFLPLIFGRELFDCRGFFVTLGGMVSFSLLSSMVYIVNDIQDREKDRLHITKKNRPIASRQISVEQGVLLACILFTVSVIINFIISDGWGFMVLLLYLCVNLGYSCFGAKNIAILDIILLVVGFFLRVLYGATITNIPISNWLYLTVIAGSFYMALGKRRNEIQGQGKKTREVLKYYTAEFLDKNMYMCMAIAIVFYSMWCLDVSASKFEYSSSIVWTVPVVLVLAIRYSFDIENGTSDGDPVEVILKDKVLILLGMLYVILIVGIIYL